MKKVILIVISSILLLASCHSASTETVVTDSVTIDSVKVVDSVKVIDTLKK